MDQKNFNDKKNVKIDIFINVLCCHPEAKGGYMHKMGMLKFIERI